jgi:hypothetical protein
MIATQPPNYEYTPNDFMVLSLVTVILCGIFSPLSLVLSLPALFFSQQVSVHGLDWIRLYYAIVFLSTE